MRSEGKTDGREQGAASAGGREDWCSPASLPETQVPERIPSPSPHKPHEPHGSSAGFIRRILLFTPMLFVPVLPAPNRTRLCLSSHLLPVSPQLWLSQASSSWPIQRTSRLWWYPAQLGTARGWGCAPCALEEETPCPREGSSLGQHHQPGALCWWDASQGHGWLGTGNSPAARAKLGGSNGEKSGGCLIPPPQPCKSSPHSLVQEIASQAATILRPV